MSNQQREVFGEDLILAGLMEFFPMLRNVIENSTHPDAQRILRVSDLRPKVLPTELVESEPVQK